MQTVVTIIGGGTGSFNILTGLRTYRNLWLQSVVTMMDSGGDSGRLRDEFGVLPPGDVRRCLVALSEETELLRELFSFRFEDPPLKGRSFGNLFILALTKLLGSEEKAVDGIAQILKIRGRVIPVTLDHANLCAELENGSCIIGEANIDLPSHDPSIPIKRVYLNPQARANPSAVNAIGTSDFIVFAPGNLYTSIVPNLLVHGIPEAIGLSHAPLICILNLMTVYGETQGYTASRHIAEIAAYAGRMPDAVIVHKGDVPRELAIKYKAEAAEQVRADIDELYRLGIKVVKHLDVMSTTSYVRHDPVRISRALVQLFEELNPSIRQEQELESDILL
ncbi:MAG: YvcK family protein [Acidobacteriota bacterium]|nr:MAG: YvcK family protein [Acidobacteriota bacterium]